MTPRPKLLFDECVGAPIIDILRPLLEKSGLPPEMKHVLEFQRAGVPDAVWIPEVRDEGYIIITTDRGRRGDERDEDKLPYLCRRHRITHVLLSAPIHAKNTFGKAQAIVTVWDDFQHVMAATRGTRFLLRLTPKKVPVLENLDARREGKRGQVLPPLWENAAEMKALKDAKQGFGGRPADSGPPI